ncbi:hypothetical protein FJR41_004490 [Dolichospermum planctonicum UHCC 0167]|jgi:uncharacterized protein (DUF3084 family)|uniref:hypothetical protein n=1 Tax=Dolichospermum planctonicum TaxID=136072 RepID=UPI0014434DF7|nr:hypothetical protein [Dolichospermum planctonicum]MCW9680076.1 hypothetical protein [Dolichospermum planctonicum UHCC 0167]
MGFFLVIHNGQLRYFSLAGSIIPTPQEAAKDEMVKANQAIQIAKQESQRAKQESQRAKQANKELCELKQKMRSLGISLE